MYKKKAVYLSIQPTQEWPWQPQRKAFDEQAPEPMGSQIPASKQDRCYSKQLVSYMIHLQEEALDVFITEFKTLEFISVHYDIRRREI